MGVYYFVHNAFSTEYDMNYALTELKEQEPWLHNYYSKMLQMVSKQVAAGNKALLTLKRNGRKVGKLSYRTHEEYNSFTYNQSGFRIKGGNLRLSKIGSIKIVLHRQPISIKQVTVCRQGPLKRAHRRVSRRHKGSNNRTKARHMLARLYQRMHNKRHDFLHKLSTNYANRYDIIFLERLHMLNMIRNHRLARYILDSSWGTFKSMIGYKAKKTIEVEPAYTSIGCSNCGNLVPKALVVRMHRCNRCGLVIDRDYDASLNNTA